MSKGYCFGLRRDVGRYSRGESTWPDSSFREELPAGQGRSSLRTNFEQFEVQVASARNKRGQLERQGN